MIDYIHKGLFNKDSVHKNLRIVTEDALVIENASIYSESFELTESLCSEPELKFGCCEASMMKLKIRNEFGNLSGKFLNVSMILNGDTENPFKIGQFKVDSSKPSGDRKYTDIVAYDKMFDILNADVTAWYESLKFPISLKKMRDSFFLYVGVEQKEIELLFDYDDFDKTIATNSISGKDVITAICELNGVFGHISRDGLFEYISLPDRASDALYPSTTLYPNTSLYPSMTKYDIDYENVVSKGKYRTCTFEDFETDYISVLQIRQESGDIGAVATYSDLDQGDWKGMNSYVIEDNFLTYGISAASLRIMAISLLRKICRVKYRPFKAELRGNLCIEVGDYIRIKTRIRDVDSYVLNRTIKGIQALKDSFESQGVYQHKEKVNSVNREVKRIRGKTNILERTVEETKSLITDEEKGLQTQVSQNAEQILLKVDRGTLSAEISLEDGELITIRGNRLVVESDNFKLTEDGFMEAVSAVLSGKFQSLQGIYDVTIDNGKIYIGDGESGHNLGFIAPMHDNESGTNTALTTAMEQEATKYSIIIKNKNGEGYYSLYRVKNISYSNIDNETDVHTWWGHERHYGNMSVDKNIDVSGNANIYGDLSVYGTKPRVIKTKSYDDRLLYCYEMPSPIFGDIGHGIIGKDGLCYVDIESIFAETVDTIQNYQVFLQSYSENNVFVYEKTQDYFVIKGEPNTEFDWEIKAKQIDLSGNRLEEIKQKYSSDEQLDYVLLSEEYLNNYNKEIMNYEQY